MKNDKPTPTGAKLRVCRYLRKSRDDGEGETLEETLARHARMTEVMASDRGLEISHTYYEVVSGESIEDRPEMMKLLYAIRDMLWDIVIVVEVSRLSRGDGSDQQRIINAFQLTSTECLAGFKMYDLEDKDDCDLFKRKLQSSREEYEAIVERLNGGVTNTINSGYSAGGITPYGLKRIGSRRKYTYEQDPETFDNYLEILRYCHDEPKPTWGGLRRHLHALGIKSPTGKNWWSLPALRYLIENDKFLGRNIWGVHQTKYVLTDSLGRQKKRVINDNPTEVDAKWPAFVDEEYLKEARARINGEPKVIPNRTLKNPLAGLLRCNKCGYLLVRRPNSGNGHLYYVHPNWKNDDDCKCKAVQVDHVLNLLAETLEADANEAEYLLGDGGIAETRERIESNIERTEKEVASAKKSRVDVYDRLERGVIDEDVYAVVDAREKERIEALLNSIAEQKQNLDSLRQSSIEEHIVCLHQMIDAIRGDSLTPEQVNNVLKQFIGSIMYSNDAPPRTREQKVNLDISFTY